MYCPLRQWAFEQPRKYRVHYRTTDGLITGFHTVMAHDEASAIIIAEQEMFDYGRPLDKTQWKGFNFVVDSVTPL